MLLSEGIKISVVHDHSEKQQENSRRADDAAFLNPSTLQGSHNVGSSCSHTSNQQMWRFHVEQAFLHHRCLLLGARFFS
jgi:hypothetical protein